MVSIIPFAKIYVCRFLSELKLVVVQHRVHHMILQGRYIILYFQPTIGMPGCISRLMGQQNLLLRCEHFQNVCESELHWNYTICWVLIRACA